VKVRARGRWLAIFSALAPELNDAMTHLGRHVPCPVHGGTDGFRLFNDAASTGGGICNTCGSFADGFALLQWLTRRSFQETLVEVHRVISGEVATPNVKASQPRTKDRLDDATLRRILNSTWAESVALNKRDARLAVQYLENRGLRRKLFTRLADLRFHPRLLYREKGRADRYLPGLLALVRAADGTPVTVHRTYLSEHGDKAKVRSPRKLFPVPTDAPALAGTAVQLSEPRNVLGIAEGIETALSAYEASGTPCWSAINATLLERWRPPQGVDIVHIWADRDRNGRGLRAAKVLKARLWKLGIKALIWMPSGEIVGGAKSVDWNDVLRRGDVSRFPNRRRANQRVA
jgi:phage/plasmid primase-like uncharacterized protein